MTNLATNALTSLADVKESLGIASSDQSYDNLITRTINRVSQQIENYCGRVFKAADYTEDINGTDTDELLLKQRPVNSITSLQYRAANINRDNFITLDAETYFLDANPGILKLLFRATGHWNRYRVTYNAGYTTIPSDLAEAACSLVCYFIQNADSGVGVKTKMEGQRKIEYYEGPKNFRDLMKMLGIDEIIDGYANWPLRSE